MERRDIAIIGTGPGGVSAAITAKIRGKQLWLFGTRHLSEKLEKAKTILNYPGLPAVSGMALAEGMRAQLKSLDIPILETQVTAVYAMGDYFAIQTPTDMYEASAVILAAGVVMGKPFPGEKELLGRGVSYCATCDGMLYRGKPVAVVGYTDTARQEAEFLQKIGCSVTYFDRPKQCEIRGDGRVESVTCDGRTIPAEGVFILRPTMAPTELFPGLAVEQGYVTVDRRMATNLPGLFAAGDCTGGPLQVSKAAGDGLIAGQSAAAWAAAQERREKQS